jgi:hypothetical protein
MTYRIHFDTNLGPIFQDVSDDEVMERVGQIQSMPGTSNVSVEMLDSTAPN